jgi:hypothetical protein
MSYCAPTTAVVHNTPWTRRALAPPEYVLSSFGTKYKPVHRKVHPVPSYMPDPEGQIFKPVIIDPQPALPLNPPFFADFIPTKRLTLPRLQKILSGIPSGFLHPREVDLLIHILDVCQQGLVFVDMERGTFSAEYFPDYEIPVIEHTPWIQPPIRIPKAIEAEVRELIEEQRAAGKFEYSTASYHSCIFAATKKGGLDIKSRLRLVADVQELNKVTVHDSALPPCTDDFAEGFVGCCIYGMADLFAGYDGRVLSPVSRPLTTFGCMVGPMRSTVLPQGATNSIPEFQKCTNHVLHEESPKNSGVFIDDVGIKGPFSNYNDIEISPRIHQFVYEYATTLDRFFARFIKAGITASGKKLILATPRLSIVGTVVSAKGWHLDHGISTKVKNWPIPMNISEIRGFLGTASVG